MPFRSNVLMPVLFMSVFAVAGIAVFPVASAQGLERVRVSEDKRSFVTADSGRPFIVWGVNYDHDADGALLDEYWVEDWDRVVEDFGDIKALGANCVRIHLQFGKFMEAPDRANDAALGRLKKLLSLAERSGLYLNVTGLACYHKQNIPPWYDQLNEQDRWRAQQVFWRAIATTCSGSPAVFCYDLMNEPILPGKDVETEWLGGELGGKFFVQRIALDAAGRSRQAIAESWVRMLVSAIRRHDPDRLITVGVIPWIFVFDGKGKPLFYGPEVGRHLDFVSVHFYPRKGEVDAAIAALRKYEVGMPVVVEEMFPLRCGIEELEEFIRRSSDHVDGWISFYWGETAASLRAKTKPTIRDAIVADWLTRFSDLATDAKRGTLAPAESTD